MNLNQQLQQLYNQQYTDWELARKNIDSLKNVELRTFPFDGFEIKAQFNPARIVSSAAKTDAQSIQERKCFLCEANRPEIQKGILYQDQFEILMNPFPILPFHFTVTRTEHVPQEILPYYSYMLNLAEDLTEFTVLYNGPAAGASAPDHMHFQVVEANHLPIENEYKRLKQTQSKQIFKQENGACYSIRHYLRSCLVIESKDKKTATSLFEKVYSWLQQEKDKEPLMNVFCIYRENTWITFVFPREKHRPTQYFAEGDEQMLISPGAIDIAGMLIMPRKNDFDKLNKDIIVNVFEQVSKNIEEPIVSVGIMNEKSVSFVLNGNFNTSTGKIYTGEQHISYKDNQLFFDNQTLSEISFCPISEGFDFELKDVTIGINFHWERKENQRFSGSLKFIVENEKITVINILSVEDYLKSVISSEMSASASLELLKAHAVISRSWLLANMAPSSTKEREQTHLPNTIPLSCGEGLGERSIWYERDAHVHFNVCADDHCQRYQGITRTNTQAAIQAVEETRGEVLMSEKEICDARFSKSCGGMSEKFENCWADVPHSYLTNVIDNPVPPQGFDLDLTVEASAGKWIRQSPPAFCNTQDKKILSQVLNNYDQETTDFYRWKVVYSRQELSELLQKRSGIDFGEILDLIPVERGASGRLVKLKIIGTKCTIVVGKELEIRKWLSPSHLYSSAFVVDKKMDEDGLPETFTLTGAGWGHGVGLCQIGAAVMGEKGYKYDEILVHYYRGSELKKLYL